MKSPTALANRVWWEKKNDVMTALLSFVLFLASFGVIHTIMQFRFSRSLCHALHNFEYAYHMTSENMRSRLICCCCFCLIFLKENSILTLGSFFCTFGVLSVQTKRTKIGVAYTVLSSF